MKLTLNNILNIFIGCTISGAAISSCALLGPDYKKPDTETPQSWQNSAPNTKIIESGVNLSDVSWWNRFNDPTLNNLINQALENNNDIQSAIGNISIASSNLKQVNMAWVPTISIGGIGAIGQMFNTTNTSTNPTINNATNIPGISGTTNFNFYSYGLIPSYTLNIFQQLKKQDVAKMNLTIAKISKDAVRLTVISQVSGSYFTLLALNQQLSQQQQLCDHLKILLTLVKTQYKYGLATLNDVQNYQQQLSQAKMQVPGTEYNIVVIQNALRVLINKNPGKVSNLNTFAMIKTDRIIPVNLPSSVLNNRPDIKMAEEQLKISNANIGVATSNFFPTISLTTPLGGYNSQLGNLLNGGGDFWVAQIAAIMPILNLSLYNLVKKTKGQYYVAYYNYIKTVRNAFADVNNNLSGYEQIQNTYSEANVYFTSTNSNSELNALSYKNGYLSYPESLKSIINADNASIMLTQTKLQELQAIILLYQSLAGGYNYKNTEKLKKFNDDHDV